MNVNKRLIGMGIVFLCSIFILLVRLADIQLINPEQFGKRNINLLEASVSSRTRSVVLDDGRGVFTDRNGNSLTEQTYNHVILFPFLEKSDWPKNQLATILGVSVAKIEEELDGETEPFAFPKTSPIVLTDMQIMKIEELKSEGIIVAERKVSRTVPLAEHVIGLVRENGKRNYIEREGEYKIPITTRIGITGLQKTFDELLISETGSKLLYHVDGRGNALFGEEVKYFDNGNPFFPVTVQTTIDVEMQRMVETALDNRGIKKGTAVLLDVKSNEVLAMASRPKINEKDPLNSGTSINWAVETATPGSVFKIVVAAAALEQLEERTQQSFDCNLNLYGENTLEWHKQKGMLSFEESFSQSCNYTFATLAEELLNEDEEALDEAMNRLGIESKVGWHGSFFHYNNFMQFEEEKMNTIYGGADEKLGKKTLNQIGIGQWNVKLSPLAVANMIATIARGGNTSEVKIVDEVQYKDGTTLYDFPNNEMNEKSYSENIIKALQKMMVRVVESNHGTGRLVSGLPYAVAGKTGTAEVGEEGSMLHNKWFVGYFPYDKPKYALVVVEHDTTSDNGAYALAYGDIVKSLYNYDNK